MASKRLSEQQSRYGSFALGKRRLPRHAAFFVSQPRLSVEFRKVWMRAAGWIWISSSVWEGMVLSIRACLRTVFENPANV
ncbi:hypothetical protein [Pseudomonas viridiflava]|nr:hypothetical protein PS634_05364 [Pseudomonas fluorescens]